MEPQDQNLQINYTFSTGSTVPTYDAATWANNWIRNQQLHAYKKATPKAKKHYPTVQKQILGALDEGMEITSAKIEDDTLYVQIKGPDKLVYNIQIDIYEDDK